MSVKASCPHCKKSFTAPEEYRGKKIECPACARRFVLHTEEDLSAFAAQEEATRRKREEDRERLALIERQDSRGQRRSGRPYYEEYQTGLEGVRHFNPRAPSRFLRLRALSDFLVVGAYLELLLIAVGIGLLIHLRWSGIIGSVSLTIAIGLVWAILGVALFLFFKYLGELAFLLADVGDGQNDVVQLLQDLRDNTDRRDSENP